MSLKNAVLSLLDMFKLSKGRKIVEEPVALTPLLQRLDLPEMPDNLEHKSDKVSFVAHVIARNIAAKKLPMEISRRVIHKISRYYGLRNLKGFGIFQAVPGKPRLLEFAVCR